MGVVPKFGYDTKSRTTRDRLSRHRVDASVAIGFRRWFRKDCPVIWDGDCTIGWRTFVTTSALQAIDPALHHAIQEERTRQRDGLELIASENYTSAAVLEAVGTVLTNKYAEGYPGRRYYGGCEFVDKVENLARDRGQATVRRGTRQCSAARGLAGQHVGLHVDPAAG